MPFLAVGLVVLTAGAGAFLVAFSVANAALVRVAVENSKAKEINLSFINSGGLIAWILSNLDKKTGCVSAAG